MIRKNKNQYRKSLQSHQNTYTCKHGTMTVTEKRILEEEEFYNQPHMDPNSLTSEEYSEYLNWLFQVY